MMMLPWVLGNVIYILMRQIYRKEPLPHTQVNVSSEDDRSGNPPPTERNCRTSTIKSESPGITEGPALQKYSFLCYSGLALTACWARTLTRWIFSCLKRLFVPFYRWGKNSFPKNRESVPFKKMRTWVRRIVEYVLSSMCAHFICLI